jgi:hypothetical protein
MDRKSEALAERAKTKWFHEGERSNKYFLNLLRRRTGLTNINSLKINDVTISDEDEIKKEVSSFYKKLYENGRPSLVDDTFFQYIRKVNAESAEMLIKELTKEEIYNTLKECKDSAPGPDGIPYSYYRKFWHIFGDE